MTLILAHEPGAARFQAKDGTARYTADGIVRLLRLGWTVTIVPQTLGLEPVARPKKKRPYWAGSFFMPAA